MITKAPKGTEDLLPQDSYRWQYLEEKFKKVCDNFGYKEIRVPTFEHTELFERGVGDTTDVVEKQMYTFLDKGDRSITLRPEGTASVVRCFLERNLYAETLPLKMWYNLPCFRYENKQKGRLREFHQFGIEAFGSKGPLIDAEVVTLAITFLKNVGLSDLSVNINSIGCPECRRKYNEILKDYLRPKIDELCDTCKNRFERNPLRILDCKSNICGELVKDAPRLLDHICDECREHFEAFKKTLDSVGIEYKVDDGIVRGLDYYTKTVFEIISGPFTVCGGGRYDGLVEELGGDSTPAIGFGLGIERLLIRLSELGIEIPNTQKPDLYIAPLGEKAQEAAGKLCFDLRVQGISAETDLMQRGLKPQMKYSNKIGAKYTLVLGDSEIETGNIKLKNMETGEQTELDINNIADFFKEGK
ncbi:MAG: histidine--tRNA ligase [Ruminococcaceae bacterium]|nr:histidine--tRNA ligase [Oscillospiraceae bacterium]